MGAPACNSSPTITATAREHGKSLRQIPLQRSRNGSWRSPIKNLHFPLDFPIIFPCFYSFLMVFLKFLYENGTPMIFWNLFLSIAFSRSSAELKAWNLFGGLIFWEGRSKTVGGWFHDACNDNSNVYLLSHGFPLNMTCSWDNLTYGHRRFCLWLTNYEHYLVSSQYVHDLLILAHTQYIVYPHLFQKSFQLYPNCTREWPTVCYWKWPSKQWVFAAMKLKWICLVRVYCKRLRMVYPSIINIPVLSTIQHYQLTTNYSLSNIAYPLLTTSTFIHHY